jgi:hypothetical protein
VIWQIFIISFVYLMLYYAGISIMYDALPAYTNIQLRPFHLPERSAGIPITSITTDKTPVSNIIQPQNNTGMSIPGALFNWGKGFTKGVFSYTIGLLLNPFKLALVIGAGIGGALLLMKRGFSINNAVKTELIAVGAYSAVKGVFDIGGFISNNGSGRIDKARESIDSFGKSCAHMCLPLAIPLVPAATRLAGTKGVDFAKYAIKKLV